MTKQSRCRGTLSRRAFVRVGTAGLGTLGLSQLLELDHLRAAEGSERSPKSMIKELL